MSMLAPSGCACPERAGLASMQLPFRDDDSIRTRGTILTGFLD